MKLDIVLRTHDRSNAHTYEPRFVPFDKRTLIEGCLASLINSANRVIDHEITFTIFDDHSSDEFVKNCHALMTHSRWPYTFTSLTEKGYNHSAFKQFERCRNSTADLVYSVEDDYLHYPTAIQEMIDNWQLFTSLSGREVCLFPFDFPDDYRPQPSGLCFVVYGTHRHWRSGLWTTQTMFLRPNVFCQYWPTFEKLALEYNADWSVPGEHVHEGNTIGQIWKDSVLRMSPIPSLALHMQFERQKDPYINWLQWWTDFGVLEKINT